MCRELVLKKCFVRLVKTVPLRIKRSNQYPVLWSLIYLIFIMHDFVMCYRVWCKEAENEQCNKNFGPSQMINLATCWALQLTSFYYTPNFVEYTFFWITWQKFLILKLVRQRNLSKNEIKTRYMSFSSVH